MYSKHIVTPTCVICVGMDMIYIFFNDALCIHVSTGNILRYNNIINIMPTSKYHATTSKYHTEISKYHADTSKYHADTNKYHADTNKYHADK